MKQESGSGPKHEATPAYREINATIETFLARRCLTIKDIMKRLLTTAFLAALLIFDCAAQQRQQRLNQIVQATGASAEPQTKNYQLELTMSRAGKTATYRMTFNGGQISTDLLDKLAEQGTNAEPRTINLSVSFIPFEDEGGEASVFVSRNITFRTKAQGQEGKPDREIVQQKSIGLTTKVAMRPGRPVVIFDDEDEKITLKLTEL
jgi:hypothetical protein